MSTVLETAPAASETIQNETERDLLGTLRPFGRAGRVWTATLSAFVLIGLGAWIRQLVNGLEVTAMRDYVSWGLYITTFVFFIGISHAGTLISAVLRVTHAEWRRPITRMAEAVTVFALLIGASMVIVDMGRPDRLLNIVRFGRFQSPILWDVVCIFTYLTGSLLYLYTAMLPDLSLLARHARETGRSARLARFYEVLSLGYDGSAEQRRRLDRAIGAMAVIIIPVMVSVHTVVSWVFGMTLRAGWHSTIFGSYFVVGAIYSGVAAVLTAMAAVRWVWRLDMYLELRHFRNLAKLLLAVTLLYAYFTLSEYLTMWYGGVSAEAHLLQRLMASTPYGPAFWIWAVLGLFVPLALLIMPGHRSLGAIVTASVLINIGMFVKRYLIVVPTLQSPNIPAEWAGRTSAYFPTFTEWAIMMGGIAAFLLMFTGFTRIFPILSVWETAEHRAETRAREEVSRTRGGPRTISIIAIVVLFVSVAVAAAPAAGQQTTAVTVERLEEDGEDLILAEVLLWDQPVEGARVAFYVERTFGNLLLGEDVTLDDGTAAVEFPADLPPGPDGALNFVVEVLSPADVAGATGSLAIPVDPAVSPDAGGDLGRALWAPRAPLPVLLTIGFLLLCVWSTYAFVGSQLVFIHRSRSAD